jgi:uncharacterized protein (DUF1800 family)
MNSAVTSRRRLLVGGAAAVTATAAAQVVGSGSAQAALVTYTPNPYTATLVPSYTQLHYMNRLGAGFSPTTFEQMRAAGTVSAWLNKQLSATPPPESPIAQALPTWFPALEHTPALMWSNVLNKTKVAWDYSRDLANLTMLRRMYSTRTVFETLVDFWSNHLHIFANADLAWVQRASYDKVIRKHALGRFEDMLVEAALHPAMLLYLDNWKSEKGAPNENQGRELLELHTVGRASGYTEQMVKDSAKILSGYTVDARGTWAGYYDSAKHTTGPVQVLEFSAANDSADGQELAKQYLRFLARHPATARNLATKLGRYFVSDTPSESLVSTVAQAYLNSGTDIKTTLRALVAHPDFLASRGKLTRTTTEDVVATARVLGITALAPTSKEAFVNKLTQVTHTDAIYHWPRPNGSPRGDDNWCTAGRMLDTFRMHWRFAAGWWPTQDVTYRTAASWLPQPSIRLDQYVDHLCRVLLGRVSTARILGAAVTATGFGPATLITPTHLVSRSAFVRLVGTLLDSPEHMRR